jgi:SAM-dependent methyltransferase
MTQASGTEGYAATADRLVGPYESISFERTHQTILPLIPAAPARVLDIGAGTGRDAAALAARGHTVVAVEPTAEMRAHGQRLHPSPAITWIDDSLPELAALEAHDGAFDLVMMTAVFMHLDAGQRARALPRIVRLMAPGGILALSLRHGPIPEGRRMFDIGAEEMTALAQAHGLQRRHHAERPSMSQVPDVTWTILAFSRARPLRGQSPG